MDLSDIHRQALAAREFTETIDGATFTLRLPTRLDSRIALTRVLAAHPGETNNDVLALRVERESLIQAIVGWTGVPMHWVLPGATAEPPLEACVSDAAPPAQFAYSPQCVALLLDTQPDHAETLGRELFNRVRRRNGVLDTAAKN